MRYYNGTAGDDYINFAQDSSDSTFSGFGQGNDKVFGGSGNDVFHLTVDMNLDRYDGGGGENLLDYSAADRGLHIDLGAGTVTAEFAVMQTVATGPYGLQVMVPTIEQVTVAQVHNFQDVVGTKYADTIIGTSGDNIIEGGAGADTIDGGGGDDTISYAHSAGAVSVVLYQAVQHYGDAEGDQLSRIDNIIGSSQADFLVGDSHDNVIEGGGGADHIEGGGSSGVGDTASYEHSSGPVIINLTQTVQHGGDAEGDSLFAMSNVIGSAWGDQITGDAANNQLHGGGGNDFFFHSGGHDTLYGDGGSDTYIVGHVAGTAGVGITLGNDGSYGSYVVYADGSQDILYSIENAVGSQNGDMIDARYVDPTIGSKIDAGGGADTVYGTDGADHIVGGAGQDTIFGDAGDDFIFGDFYPGDGTAGGDDDFIQGGAGADIIDGGAAGRHGNTAAYGFSPSGVFVQLGAVDPNGNPIAGSPGYGLGGDAQGDVLVNIQNLTGSGHDDVLRGNTANNTLYGGGFGNDTLFGGGGDDTLISGAGNDVMTGGTHDAGGDLFSWDLFRDYDPQSQSPVNAQIGRDTVTDFDLGVDRLAFAHQDAGEHAHVTVSGPDTFVTFDHVDGWIELQGVHATYDDLFH